MDIFEKNISEFGKQLTEKNLTGVNLDKLSGALPDGIIITGMGGSGLAGGVLKGVKKEIGLNLPIIIWKDYGLPEHNFKKPLYIFASFSGNTEETLSGFENILKSGKKCLIAAVTTGGRLKKLAETKNIPFVSFDGCSLTPRQSTGIMFYGLTKILKASGLSIRVKNYSEEIDPEKFRNEGKNLSVLLKGRIVVIYTDEADKHIGYIWKIKLNETAKNPAFNNVLPEMNHNEIVSFENNKFKTAAIFLKNKPRKRTEKRFRLTEQLLKEKGVSVIELKLEGGNGIEKAWRTIPLADWTTYYLAKLNGSNPLETKSIDKLKKLMR